MADNPVVDRAVDLLVGTESVAGKDILVLLPDRTRPFPFESILPQVAFILRGAGADLDRLVFAIASGTHVPGPADLDPLRSLLPGSPRILDPLPEEQMISVGTTERGTD